VTVTQSGSRIRPERRRDDRTAMTDLPRHSRADARAGRRPVLPRAALAAVLALSMLSAAAASPVLDRIKAAGTLRVCIWPEYYGITYRDPRTQRLTGLDIELSQELARDLGVRAAHVDSSFASLVADVTGDRCDVAMFAVGALPERRRYLRFTRPYLQSDIYGVTTRSNAVVRQWQDIDRPGVVVGVVAGTVMETVMRERLQHARVQVIRPPDTRERELEAGRIDVFMTDYPYSRRLLDVTDWVMLVTPPERFHVLPYAYAVKPGDEAWFQAVDAFVARIQADGRLEAAARRHRLLPIVLLRSPS
jgi:cyclohexadienyl dehydratase